MRRPYSFPRIVTLSIDPLHSAEQRVLQARDFWSALDESPRPGV